MPRGQLSIAQVRLYALKDNEDPDGLAVRAAIRKLKADFKKAFPASETSP